MLFIGFSVVIILNKTAKVLPDIMLFNIGWLTLFAW